MSLRGRAERLGYVRISCSLCGWRGWTDTGVCEGCTFCDECGEPTTGEEPCECREEEEA